MTRPVSEASRVYRWRIYQQHLKPLVGVLTDEQIAETLNERGVRQFHGGDHWTAAHIMRMRVALAKDIATGDLSVS